MSPVYAAVGFIGLGIMGLPMAENLDKKLPSSSHLYVFDVVEEVTRKLSSREKGRVHACISAKDVVVKSV